MDRSVEYAFREGVIAAIRRALEPLPDVHAGWEAGSIAFGASDSYSDIDLNFLVSDDVSLERLYAQAEDALNAVSPITASHAAPPGRYYKLKEGGEFLLVDLCFVRAGAHDHCLDVERHGHVRPLFDKGGWLHPKVLDENALEIKRNQRYLELKTWFLIGQNFVRKAILRQQDVEALSCLWGYTLKPLAELLRMRYCPLRWDFGMRYLDRDLPPAVYAQFRDLIFVRDAKDLTATLTSAENWGAKLLKELASSAQIRQGQKE